MQDRVIRGIGLLGGPPGDLIGAPVLRSTMKSHEPDVGAQHALFDHPWYGEELGQIHALRFARNSVPHSDSGPQRS